MDLPLALIIDPIKFAIVAVLVFLWRYCVQETDRRVRVSGLSRPHANTIVLIAGPPAWLVLRFIQAVELR